ncbi:hypothetical protein AALA24_01000 [Anaerovoracaceae bacterium 42-11]
MKHGRKLRNMAVITVAMIMITGQASFATNEVTEEIVYQGGEVYVENALEVESTSYVKEIDMTELELDNLYESYLDSLTSNTNGDAISTKQTIENFIDYAIEEGIIEDTPVQRAAVTKALVRADLRTLAKIGGDLGYTTASACLLHSLQDNPTNISITSSDPIAAQVKKSTEIKKIISDYKAYVRSKNISLYSTSGSVTLNSTRDLHLAFNKVSYQASGTRNSKGVWTLTITVNDTYDFEHISWKNALSGYSSAGVTLINNYAAYGQSIKAVVPYKIKITMKTTFTE